MRIHSFLPLAGDGARVLILGSMPGAASLAAGQYYAHPRNAFWTIMGDLCGAGPDQTYERRVQILRRAGIAVWDVLQCCVREGSLDSAIRDEIPNDFNGFFATQPALRHVYTNGAAADRLFRRYVTVLPAGMVVTRLPSTSPAYAAIDLHAKRAAWAVIGRALQE